MLQEAAEELGVSVESLQGKFETTPGLWGRLTHDRQKYVLAVKTALAEWCTRGNLVYHGLAGQFLLRDLPGVLRVLILAPLEDRVRTLGETHPRMTRTQLEDFIRKVDHERGRWVQVTYGADVLDTSHYDLTLNLRTLSRESACEVIAMVATQPRFEITAEVEIEVFAFAAACRKRLSRILGG